jgi:hypothetical protein
MSGMGDDAGGVAWATQQAVEKPVRRPPLGLNGGAPARNKRSIDRNPTLVQ